ncbi:hypothetical protein EW145_g6619 [Phellinidium pouzarii]|uniref:Integrase catalytic domain-containing protein n=1 Tax=Phellinidium pouzarii TaxID=167371 RepID=A0A4S4KXV6_9AGAM|nr:hypothetical protein EW145_g6619 [Phellinidium pouzarii]
MEYSSFRSALLLLTNFDFKTVKDAFLQEQKNRQPRAADSALALSSALKVSTPAKPSSQSIICEFCDIKGHTEAQCFKRRDARESILKQQKEKREKGKERANAAQQETSASAPTSVQSAEFAGNASIHDYTNPHSPLLSDAGSDWIVDTGATCHMTPHRHWFNTYTPNHTPIQLANNQIIYSVGLGSVRFQPVINGKPGCLLEFERVLHVPDLRNNLLSVLYLTRAKSYIVTIQHDQIFFKRNGALLFTAAINSNNAASINGQVVPDDSVLWHVQTRHGYHYWITFIDDHSRHWAVMPLKKKSDAFAAFKHFKAYAENQLNLKIKATRNDKGGEYMPREWDHFCNSEGIHCQHTIRAEPHQNGVAERANWTLVEGITTMLNEAHLPATFWWDAVAAFVHVHNRSPTSAVQGKTPFELWHKSKPDVSHFRVFGCTSYVHVKKDLRRQLESHTQKCVFLGYPAHFKGWTFWNPITCKEVISDSAQFDERVFPGNSRSPVDLQVPSPPETSDPIEQVGVESDSDDDDTVPLPPLPDSPATPPMPPPQNSPPPVTPVTPAHPSTKRERSPSDLPPESPKKPKVQSSAPEWRPRPRPLTSFRDALINPLMDYPGRRIPRPAPEIHPAPQPAPASETEPVQVQQSDEEDRDELDLMSEDEMQAEALMFTGLMDFGANAGLEDQYIAFEDAFDYVLKSTNHFEHVFSAEVRKQYGPEPYQWKDIRGRPDAHLWEQAAMEEFISLVENGTFTPVRLPSDRKTIGCRWVFKLKRKADGSVDRYKARLVAKGFSQRPGLEFSQVFAPTAKWAALRAILYWIYMILSLHCICLLSF